MPHFADQKFAPLWSNGGETRCTQPRLIATDGMGTAITRLRGARRMAEVPPDVLARLQEGEIETVNLMEWLAVDMSALARNVAARLSRGPLRSTLESAAEAMAGRGVTARLTIAGQAIARALADLDGPDFRHLAAHVSDIVRQWACYGDFTTDVELASEEISAEARANPSMASWGGDGYLEQQRRRLPRHKYRRLHLNLPGAPDGAAFSADSVMAAIVPGRKRLPPQKGVDYYGFVDMSGGSADDAVLAIAHGEEHGRRAVLDAVVSQTGSPPFNPRAAIKKFAAILREYRIFRVIGDAYAGETFRLDFQEEGIVYEVSDLKKSEIYDGLEPRLNAGEVELLDIANLQEQLLSLVVRGGGKIDHLPSDHDDYSNAAAGAVSMITGSAALFGLWSRLGDLTPRPAPVAGPGEVLVEVKGPPARPPALGRWVRPGLQLMTEEDVALIMAEVKPESGKVMVNIPKPMRVTLDAPRMMRGGLVVVLPGRTIDLLPGRQNVNLEIGEHLYVRPFLV